MARLPDTIQSSRGRNKLLRSSEKLVNRTLKILDLLYDTATSPEAKKSDIVDAARMYLEIMSYVKPKLQAIAPAQMGDDGDLVAIQVRRIAEQVQQQIPEATMSQKERFTTQDHVQDGQFDVLST